MIYLNNLDLEILLSYILKVDRSFLKAHPEKLLSKNQIKQFCKLAARRLQQEPIAYIIKQKSFWDITLLVTKAVLIPRPETEILVEQALAKLPGNSQAKILELGTGSGAVSLAIAKHRPNVMVYATDISIAALNIAKKNAELLKIKNIIFYKSNWFDALSNLNFKFDLIISNPPYISKEDINYCDQEIFYEPKVALFASNNGLACFKNIILNSVNYLKINGYLILEHGFNQKNKIIAMLRQANFVDITSIQDLSLLDRALVSKKI